jgi:hypothetical protein
VSLERVTLEIASLEMWAPPVVDLLVIRQVHTEPGKGMAQRMVEAATESGTDKKFLSP